MDFNVCRCVVSDFSVCVCLLWGAICVKTPVFVNLTLVVLRYLVNTHTETCFHLGI